MKFSVRCLHDQPIVIGSTIAENVSHENLFIHQNIIYKYLHIYEKHIL